MQVALFVRLRRLVHEAKASGQVLAASGTTSTAAMVSCCAHYLANVAPGPGGRIAAATPRARTGKPRIPRSAA